MAIVDWRKVKQGSTEPETITVSASGLDDLTDVQTAEFYMRVKDGTTVKVDGATLNIPDDTQLDVVIDPAGAGVDGTDAFDTVNDYEAEVKLTMTDGDVSYYPDGEDYLGVRVGDNLED